MKDYISVVVPVYNVEKYLQECVDSLLVQTYENYEILLIDDGSSDTSPTICDRYADKYSRVKVFHKENGGLSDARNYGVKKASGDYITFVDSDDIVTEFYLSDLLEGISTSDVDMSVIGMSAFKYPDEITPTAKSKDFEIISAEEMLKRMLYLKKGLGVSACGKLYKKKLIEGIFFPLGVTSEDFLTTYKFVGECNNISVCSRIDYMYRMRDDSIMHSRFDKKKLNSIRRFNEPVKYIKKNYPEAFPAAVFRYAFASWEYVSKMTYSKENRRYFNLLRKRSLPYVKRILEDDNVILMQKIKMLALTMGYIPTMLLVRAIEYSKSIRRVNIK